MDKLRENAFGLALAGTAIVLILAAYFLVYKEWAALREQSEKTTQTERALSRLARQKEITTEEHVDAAEKVRQDAKDEYQAGVDFYDSRVAEFNRYFGGVVETPDPGVFWPPYSDEFKDLIEGYRRKFEERIGGQAEQDAGADIPAIEGIGNDPRVAAGIPASDVPLTMKRFWMLAAIVKACEKLGLGGLQKVAFAEPTGPEGADRRGRRRGRPPRRRAREEEKASAVPFEIRYLPVEVTVRMRFSAIKSLLGELFATANVPFLDAREITVTKIPETVEKYSGLAEVIREDPKSPEPKKAFEEVIQEPEVEVVLKLRALDWGGVIQPEKGAEE